MPEVQDILVFYQTTPALTAAPVAWARYEASKGPISDLGEEDDPPYANALAAMRDPPRPSIFSAMAAKASSQLASVSLPLRRT